MSAADDVVSPELILVSPPEVAARARRLLPDPVRPVAAPRPAPARVSRSDFAVFYAACVAGTIGPLLLAVVAR